MDLTAVSGKIRPVLKKYRYFIFVLLLGIALMSIPEFGGTGKGEETKPTVQTVDEDPGEQLSQLLSQIKGAGKVRLLLTEAAGEKIIYQTDRTGQDQQCDTVIITNADRGQQGMVQQVIPPEYQGAVVVCQGADDPGVRLAIVEAVSNATGLSTDRISVLKMK